MGADNFSWNLRGRGEHEHDGRLRAEHARFKAALQAIVDSKVTNPTAWEIAKAALSGSNAPESPDGSGKGTP